MMGGYNARAHALAFPDPVYTRCPDICICKSGVVAKTIFGRIISSQARHTVGQ